MIMVAAVVFMLRRRASCATGEAMAPQASSLTVQTTRASIGTAIKPPMSPRTPTASPETSHSLLPEKACGFRPVFLTRRSLLLGRWLEVPFFEDLLSLFAGNEVHPFPGELGVLGVFQGRYGIGGYDVQVGRDLYDLHLAPYVRGVVAGVAEGGVGVPDHDPVDRSPHVGLPGDHVGEHVLLEAGSVLPVRLAQDLHGVVGRRHVLRGEHELDVGLGHVLEAVYAGGGVPGDHDYLAVLDEHPRRARDETVLVGGVHL